MEHTGSFSISGHHRTVCEPRCFRHPQGLRGCSFTGGWATAQPKQTLGATVVGEGVDPPHCICGSQFLWSNSAFGAEGILLAGVVGRWGRFQDLSNFCAMQSLDLLWWGPPTGFQRFPNSPDPNMAPAAPKNRIDVDAHRIGNPVGQGWVAGNPPGPVRSPSGPAPPLRGEGGGSPKVH